MEAESLVISSDRLFSPLSQCIRLVYDNAHRIFDAVNWLECSKSPQLVKAHHKRIPCPLDPGRAAYSPVHPDHRVESFCHPPEDRKKSQHELDPIFLNSTSDSIGRYFVCICPPAFASRI